MTAILFARKDSVYKLLEGCDVWDRARDARMWPGGSSCVAHPPCRGWGRLRRFSNATSEELDLALFAVAMVRKWGGVLEHPANSALWAYAGLPVPGAMADMHGGYTLRVDQCWWGYRTRKPTWLYIVGSDGLPPVPENRGTHTHVIRDGGGLPQVGKAEREETTLSFARWLVEIAKGCTGRPGA